MSRPLALTFYLVSWAAVLFGVIFWMHSSGFSVWVAVACGWFLFTFVNGMLAYRVHASRRNSAGEKPLPYFRYLLFPTGVPKPREPAPKSTHILAGTLALVAGGFFVSCGVVLAFDANWSRISDPMPAAALCVILVAIGSIFLGVARRCFVFRAG